MTQIATLSFSRIRRAIIGSLAVAGMIMMPLVATPAQATESHSTNGDFENIGSNGIVPGWTTNTNQIDVGTDALAGCPTVDFTDYAARAHANLVSQDGDEPTHLSESVFSYYQVQNAELNDIMIGDYKLLWDHDTQSYALWRDDVITPSTDFTSGQASDIASAHFAGAWELRSETTARLQDNNIVLDSYGLGGWAGISNLGEGQNGGYALKLTSDANSDSEGYVVHGPTAFSDVFGALASTSVSFDWNSQVKQDTNVLLAYLLNTDTCAQTPIVDAFNTSSGSTWMHESAVVPDDGNYRLVLISGSFDASFGGATGAEIYVDNVQFPSLTSVNGATQTFTVNVPTHWVVQCIPGDSSITASAMPALVPDYTATDGTLTYTNVGLTNVDSTLGGAQWQFAVDSCGTTATGNVQASLSAFVDSASTTTATTTSASINAYSIGGLYLTSEMPVETPIVLTPDNYSFGGVNADLTVKLDGATPQGSYTGVLTYSLVLN